MPELPDEIRESVDRALWDAFTANNTHRVRQQIIDVIAPILLKYQAKVDAEIARKSALNPETTSWAILSQFPAVPTDTEAERS